MMELKFIYLFIYIYITAPLLQRTLGGLQAIKSIKAIPNSHKTIEKQARNNNKHVKKNIIKNIKLTYKPIP